MTARNSPMTRRNRARAYERWVSGGSRTGSAMSTWSHTPTWARSCCADDGGFRLVGCSGGARPACARRRRVWRAPAVPAATAREVPAFLRVADDLGALQCQELADEARVLRDRAKRLETLR